MIGNLPGSAVRDLTPAPAGAKSPAERGLVGFSAPAREGAPSRIGGTPKTVPSGVSAFLLSPPPPDRSPRKLRTTGGRRTGAVENGSHPAHGTRRGHPHRSRADYP